MAGPPGGISRATVRQWFRHHFVSIVSTAADYVVMVGCVELGHLRPVTATVVAAFVGAFANFSFNRGFTYHATGAALSRHLWRYALVSAASLGLNAAGEEVFNGILGLQYLIARVITSVIVSNGWNYPMQRFFVFSAGRTAPAPPS
ncbi:MAG TPA: GtrA family protein [Polyangia bacterium]|nr:GtrA family protein [Polyangia bacterium]